MSLFVLYAIPFVFLLLQSVLCKQQSNESLQLAPEAEPNGIALRTNTRPPTPAPVYQDNKQLTHGEVSQVYVTYSRQAQMHANGQSTIGTTS